MQGGTWPINIVCWLNLKWWLVVHCCCGRSCYHKDHNLLYLGDVSAHNMIFHDWTILAFQNKHDQTHGHSPSPLVSAMGLFWIGTFTGKLGNPRGLAMEVMAGSLKIGYPQILWWMTLMCPIQWPFKGVHCIFRQTHDPCRNAGFFSHGTDDIGAGHLELQCFEGKLQMRRLQQGGRASGHIWHNGLPTSWPTHVGLCGEKWKTYGLFEHCSTPGTNMP